MTPSALQTRSTDSLSHTHALSRPLAHSQYFSLFHPLSEGFSRFLSRSLSLIPPLPLFLCVSLFLPLSFAFSFSLNLPRQHIPSLSLAFFLSNEYDSYWFLCKLTCVDVCVCACVDVHLRVRVCMPVCVCDLGNPHWWFTKILVARFWYLEREGLPINFYQENLQVRIQTHTRKGDEENENSPKNHVISRIPLSISDSRPFLHLVPRNWLYEFSTRKAVRLNEVPPPLL